MIIITIRTTPENRFSLPKNPIVEKSISAFIDYLIRQMDTICYDNPN